MDIFWNYTMTKEDIQGMITSRLAYSSILCQIPGGVGDTRYILGWGGAAWPLIP